MTYTHWPVYHQGQWHPACNPTLTTGNWLAERLTDVDCPDCLLLLGHTRPGKAAA